MLTKVTAQHMFSRQVDLDPKMFGIELSEGLGVMLHGKEENLTFAHPVNNYPGMICWLIGKPEKGTGAVVMLNGASGELLGMEIITAINREYQF